MHLQHDVRAAPLPTDDVHGGSLPQSLGQTTVLALAALAGCLLLLALGATLTVCWTVHPLLSAAVVVAVGWLLSAGSRVGGRLASAGPRSGGSRHG